MFPTSKKRRQRFACFSSHGFLAVCEIHSVWAVLLVILNEVEVCPLFAALRVFCHTQHIRNMPATWRVARPRNALIYDVSRFFRANCHCLNICSPQVLDKLAISHFASSNERMLAANSATQGGNKVARSGRKIEQNEVPKPGSQNRQFCSDAWAYPRSKSVFTGPIATLSREMRSYRSSLPHPAPLLRTNTEE